ncbi:hypothetical protein BROUX41_004994 [Berkeleyomyces rouxiae]|uniref:uncharacterized protein n=1 Tax=Berkeleyomyces rouxiae TaxID=2035830 RepID=UPI003B786CFB
MTKGSMTQSDASRIQSSQARAGNDMSSGSFASRAQSAGDRNAYTASVGGYGTGTGAGNSQTGNTGGSQGKK